jgi:HEAT repeat protein
VRATAATALGQIGPDARAAVPVLNDLLKDTDSSVVKAAADSLGRIGPDARGAVPALIEAMQDRDVEVRRQVVVALGRIGPGAVAAVPALTDALQNKSRPERWRYAQALGDIGPEAKSALPVLRDVAQPKSFKPDRVWSLYALVRIDGDAPAMASLTDLLKDRVAAPDAAEALGRIGPPAKAAVPALRDLLKDKNPDVRKAAGEALKKIDPGAADKEAR